MAVIFPYEGVKGTELISTERLEEEWPKTWEYLSECKHLLMKREHGRIPEDRWYGYVYLKNHEEFLGNHPRILATAMASEPSFGLDQEGRFFFTGGGSSGIYGINVNPSLDLAPEYLLGLLNSQYLGWELRQISSPFKGGYYVQRPQYLRRLPIRALDLGKPSEKRQHDGVVGLVMEMLTLEERLRPLRDTPSEERAYLERRVAQVDRAIDEAVYTLYGLADWERRLVEGND